MGYSGIDHRKQRLIGLDALVYDSLRLVNDLYEHHLAFEPLDLYLDKLELCLMLRAPLCGLFEARLENAVPVLALAVDDVL